MQSGNNLTIQVSADTSKLRADLAQAQKDVRDFTKELRKATEAGNAASIEKWSQSLDGAVRSVRAINGELKKHNEVVADGKKGIAGLTTAFGGLNTTLLGMARGLAVTAGFSGLAATLTKVKDELLELDRMELSTGFDAGVLKAFNEVAEDTGQEAGSGYKALIKLSQAFAEVRQQAREAGQQIGSAVSEFRGGDGDNPFGVLVWQAGKKISQEIKTAADAFRVLRVNMARFKDDAAGNQAALQAVIDGFTRLRKAGKIDAANQAAMQLFGKGLREIVPTLEEIAKQGGTLNDVIKELKEKGQYPDKEARERAKEYQRMLKQVSDQVDIIGYSFLKAFGPDMVAFLAEFEKRIQTTRKEIDAIVQAGNKMDEAFVRGFNRVIDAAGRAARRAAAAVKSLPGTFAAGDMPPMPAPSATADTTAQTERYTAALTLNKTVSETAADSQDMLRRAVVETGNAFAGVTDLTKRYTDETAKLGQQVEYLNSGMTITKDTAQSVVHDNAWHEMMRNVPNLTFHEVNPKRYDTALASGGTVPGRGSGDTVPALLTPGEFVVRKSAVAHYGRDMLHALNSQRYALGGLVDRLHAPVRGFADGGLVSATTSDGVSVNLHFPGGSFGLRGDKGIVAGLTREARRASMLSAGRLAGIA